MRLDPVLTQADADLDAALARLHALLRIPSISTDPAHNDDVAKAARWLVDRLRAMGAHTEAHETAGHPIVVGEIGDGAPHLMFYGHYDVQPVDPLALWTHDPFDPLVEDGPDGPVIRGRGASDDKGQLMTFVEACAAWIAVHGALPCKVTFFFEGEEESGSPSLLPFLEAHKERLSAPDIALICDTGLADRDTPAICTMLRGLVGEEVTIRTADRDLHSGLYGGAAANPARIAARILADLHDAEGRITIPGFYDGVEDISETLRADWDGMGFDATAFLGEVGLSEPAGEAGRSLLEMLWARPTAEVNGLISGYTGDGFKTVLPAEARIKISFRLVGRQDPDVIRRNFRQFVRDRLPEDAKVAFADHGASPASVMNTNHPAFEAAKQALSDEWPKPAVYVGGGGSIPVAGYFQSILGLDSVLVGFARDDDQIHAPNEKYDLRSFRKGLRSWIRILDAITT